MLNFKENLGQRRIFVPQKPFSLKGNGLVFLFLVIIIFSWQSFLKGYIPIPADTIVGLYHPFRDQVWDNFTAGVPFKNFLITDAVRQQYPWRELAIDSLKSGIFPLWNNFSFSGYPLFANLQSAVLNPFNFLFFIFNFPFAWGLQVLLQLFLGVLFLYLFLKNFRFKEEAIVLGCLSWIFGGFFVAWFEWNTVLNAAIWLPLILLAKEKIIFYFKNAKFTFSSFLKPPLFKWILILVFAESFSLFAGHLQTFFYVVVASSIYLKFRFITIAKKKKEFISLLILFLITGTISFLLMSVQLFPTLELILNSARSFDQPPGFRTDWYLPWKHLVQLFVPDFFGNPSTLNYFGEWNYGEFVSYIGIIPLFFSLLAIFHRRDKKTYFFTGTAVLSLLFALPNALSYLPYQLHLPFISTTAPSRLIFLVDFSLSILAALGLDYFLREKNKKLLIIPSLFLLLLFVSFWSVTLKLNLGVSQRNLLLPTVLLVSTPAILWIALKTKKEKLAVIFLIIIATFDLLRFSQKFNPFVKKDWVFPSTKTTEFLQQKEKPFRIAATDSRIFPPNFSVIYNLESIEGYDPLYPLSYAEYWASVKRNRPDVSSFNFNRILTPQIIDSPFMNLLNVRYLLSFDEYQNPNLRKVFTQGQTKIYENLAAFPRAFMVGETIAVETKKEQITRLFTEQNNLNRLAVVEGNYPVPFSKNATFSAVVNIGQYDSQKMVISTRSNNPGWLVIANPYYPGWRATIDGKKEKIIRTNYLLQGLLVPAGKHEVVIKYRPLSFFVGLATSGFGLTLLIIWGVAVWKNKK